MKKQYGVEKFRWQIVKAMIDEDPILREKVKTYLEVPTD
jgi:hypothetical protein